MRTPVEDRTDHLGNIFESKNKMCKYWGVNNATFATRMKNGYSKEKALTEKPFEQIHDVRTDHLGNVFETISKMCDHWNISDRIYLYRIKLGWSKEKALTTKSNKNNIEDRTDHLGNEFDSVQKMCDHHEVSFDKYRSRIKAGWSKEKALTFKDNASISIIEDRTDHLGKVFESMTEMCNNWNVKRTIYNSRIKLGYTKEEALDVIPLINKRTNNADVGNISIIKFAYDYEDILYFKCKYQDKIQILSKDNIIREYRKECNTNA